MPANPRPAARAAPNVPFTNVASNCVPKKCLMGTKPSWTACHMEDIIVSVGETSQVSEPSIDFVIVGWIALNSGSTCRLNTSFEPT